VDVAETGVASQLLDLALEGSSSSSHSETDFDGGCCSAPVDSWSHLRLRVDETTVEVVEIPEVECVGDVCDFPFSFVDMYEAATFAASSRAFCSISAFFSCTFRFTRSCSRSSSFSLITSL
jgi:hypothetical protein